MKNLFVWNTFMQWKPVAIKEQKVTENQVGPDDVATDKDLSPAEAQAIDQIEQGVSYEERWRLVQYFSDWIKNADVRIQMLLAVQGFIVAAYGALIPAMDKNNSFWNFWTYFWVASFVVSVITSFVIGFLQFPNREVGGAKGNVFFYGLYENSNQRNILENVSSDTRNEHLSDQLVKLANIANTKFKNVQKLQTSVFLSSLFLALAAAGFIPWISTNFYERPACSILAILVILVIILVIIGLWVIYEKKVKKA